MSSVTTLPFRSAPQDCVRAATWLQILNGRERPLADALVGWEPNDLLRLRQGLRVDSDAIRSACGLDADTLFRVVAVWRATGTSVRGASTALAIEGTGEHDLDVTLELNNAELGGDLEIETQVTLGSPGPTRPLTPFRRGTVLWSETRSVRLEGGGALFPVSPVAFSSVLAVPARAAWHFDVDRDGLEMPTLAALRLLINTEHPIAQRLVADDGSAADVQDVLAWDAARQLVLTGVMSEEFRSAEAGHSWPRGSLGSSIRKLFDRHLPGHSPASLFSKLHADPAGFDSVLQSQLGFLRGGR